MGRPLAHVPDPVGDGHASLRPPLRRALHRHVLDGLGIHPDRYYWMSDIYPTGEMDPLHPDRARPGGDGPRHLPPRRERPAPRRLAPAPGRLRELRQDRDDDRRPTGTASGSCYECRPNLVTWATGCGHSGWVSPFGGRAKLPWNLEWAAQWSLFGVTIEPCGKDLSTAGGSRDRSDAIAREVFEREPPLNVPYEFINIGGKKMSTSKGRGAAAHEIVDVIPPEQLRFFFLRPQPNHAVDFDPIGNDAMPRLFDEFDRVRRRDGGQARSGASCRRASRARSATRCSTANADVAAEAAAFRPAFGHLALLAPDPERRRRGRGSTAEKGSALDDARGGRSSTSASAPPAAGSRPTRRTGAPRGPSRCAAGRGAAALDDEQRRYLGALADRVDAERPAAGDAWQDRDLRRGDAGRARCERPAFAAIYLAFLGRTNGPRAGWLLATPRRRVRPRAAARGSAAPGGGAA